MTRRGDIILQGRAILLRARFEETLTRVATVGARLIVTSPPYANARTYGADVCFTDADYARLGDHVWRALVPGGQALVVVSAPVRTWRSRVGTERGLHPWRLLIDWTDRIGFRVPDQLGYYWHGAPGAYTGRFRQDWEPLLWFERPGGTARFNKHVLAEQSVTAYTGQRATMRDRAGKTIGRIASGWAAERQLHHCGTVWQAGHLGHGHDTRAADLTGHPARFPLRLALDLVRCFSRPGDLVVDPFLGSGTVLAAACLTGRRFVGGDPLDRQDGQSWVRVAYTRLLAEQTDMLSINSYNRRYPSQEDVVHAEPTLST